MEKGEGRQGGEGGEDPEAGEWDGSPRVEKSWRRIPSVNKPVQCWGSPELGTYGISETVNHMWWELWNLN